MNVVRLTQKLIQFPSVTPQEAGCLDFIESYLGHLGFECHRLPFGEVDNLYARFGKNSPHFCFAGHIDVVSEIDATQWRFPPFKGVIHEEMIYGRGAVDMKGAIAAFLCAVHEFVRVPFKGSISLLLTSDEEGPAVNGTQKILEWLQAKNEKIQACLVGEPTNPNKVGEMIKIGRRGSLNVDIIVEGIAGHVAYPDLAQNPIPVLLGYLQQLLSTSLDLGTQEFSPSHIEITSIDTNNRTRNIIPARVHAKGNIRFNTLQSLTGLLQKLEKEASSFPLKIDILPHSGAEAFISKNPDLIRILTTAVQEICGDQPTLSTTGGTSDARFIKDICPVIEFGLVSATAHHIDEHIALSQLHQLTSIYQRVLKNYFTAEKIK